jgi:uncharacterized protein (UPF0548 family)
VETLSPGRRARLAAAPLTFAAPGATDRLPPAGYDVLRRSRVLGRGRACFAAVASALSGWEVHEGAGLGVAASEAEAREGADVDLLVGIGRARLRVPCRVVKVWDGDARKGFAYATLPGHPEAGEEAFEVVLAADGTVRGVVTAYSRPAWLLARAGGPVSRLAQRCVADRYLAAMADAAG